MFEIRELSVNVEDRPILRDVNLSIEKGETVALFGPNGSGKTSLLHTIMGLPGYQVVSGAILFRGEDITGKTLDQRARMGIGLAFQRPPGVRGVKLADVVRILEAARPGGPGGSLQAHIKRLDLEQIQLRDLNLGFSGGETKRSELLQLLAQRPYLVLLDEPDSGVDLISITTVGRTINFLLEKEVAPAQRERSGLIITHSGCILDHVTADRACVMVRGRIICTGNAGDLLQDISTRGYEGCVQCVP